MSLLPIPLSDAEAQEILIGYITSLPPIKTRTPRHPRRGDDGKTIWVEKLITYTPELKFRAPEVEVGIIQKQENDTVISITYRGLIVNLQELIDRNVHPSVLYRYDKIESLNAKTQEPRQTVFDRKEKALGPGENKEVIMDHKDNTGLLETYRDKTLIFSTELVYHENKWVKHGIEQKWFVMRDAYDYRRSSLEPVVFYYWLNDQRVTEEQYANEMAQLMEPILIPDINRIVSGMTLPK